MRPTAADHSRYVSPRCLLTLYPGDSVTQCRESLVIDPTVARESSDVPARVGEAQVEMHLKVSGRAVGDLDGSTRCHGRKCRSVRHRWESVGRDHERDVSLARLLQIVRSPKSRFAGCADVDVKRAADGVGIALAQRHGQPEHESNDFLGLGVGSGEGERDSFALRQSIESAEQKVEGFAGRGRLGQASVDVLNLPRSEITAQREVVGRRGGDGVLLGPADIAAVANDGAREYKYG
jgi:hypothetical protein